MYQIIVNTTLVNIILFSKFNNKITLYIISVFLSLIIGAILYNITYPSSVNSIMDMNKLFIFNEICYIIISCLYILLSNRYIRTIDKKNETIID
jgi:NADH:ubiquinone oxidoreductase subunit 2 (subunit N)